MNIKSLPKPNLIIPGAGRGGTTALYELLNQHPDIFFPYIKEPMFFGKNYIKDVGWYLNLFHNKENDFKGKLLNMKYNFWNNEKVIGEASTEYLFCKNSPARMKKFNKDFKFIFILRNPVQRAFSNYKRDVQVKGENETFESIINKNDERAYRYIQYGLYAKHILNYLNFFPKKQMYFILFEEFIVQPKKELKSIFDFLEVDSTFSFDFDKINTNPSKMPLSLGLQKLISNHLDSTVENSILREVVSYPIRHLLNKINHIYDLKVNYPKLSNDMRISLQNFYKKDILNLEKLIQKDLGCWLE